MNLFKKNVVEQPKGKQQLFCEKDMPWWDKFHERTIIKCSLTGDAAWYKDMIGKTIKIKQFGSFGAWDENNRWIAYWDLSPHSAPFNR